MAPFFERGLGRGTDFDVPRIAGCALPKDRSAVGFFAVFNRAEGHPCLTFGGAGAAVEMVPKGLG